MYEQEKIKPYGGKGDKGKLVEEMFNNIAPTYDKLNHRLSWNIDRYWRKKAIRRLAPYKPETMLDIATGTGDFAILSSKMLQPNKVIGVDLSEKMIEIAQAKVTSAGIEDKVCFQKGDCLNLPFESGELDAVTAAFGIRNFSDLDKGLNEMCRVLKTGGHIAIVELTTPMTFPMRQLFKVYSHTILPLYGRLISKDTDAYKYLTATIEAFPQGERMVEILHKAGFSEATFKRMTFGICTMYVATK